MQSQGGRSRLPLPAHLLFRSFSLITRSKSTSLSPTTSLLASDIFVCALLNILQSDARWPIDPTRLSRPLPLCCCFRTRIRPTSATAAVTILHLGRYQPYTSNDHNTYYPLTLALDPSLLLRINSDCFVCCLAARNQTPWLRTSRASPRSHAISSSLTPTSKYHKHQLDLLLPSTLSISRRLRCQSRRSSCAVAHAISRLEQWTKLPLCPASR